MPSWRDGADRRSPTPGQSGARRSSQQGAQLVQRAAAPAPGSSRRSSRSRPALVARRVERAAGVLRPGSRRLRRRAEVPARLRARVAAGAAASARCRWRRCARWRAAASTTRSAAASRATPSTRPGRCPTSRRCSTTTRCSRAPTCTAGRSRATSGCAACAARRSTGRCARCAAPRAASAPRSTPTPRASRAGSTCGRSRSCARRSAPLADDAIAYFGATERGNFEGGATCSRAAGRCPSACPRSARALLEARARRVRPGLDDKRLTAWNALMIAALAEAGAALGRADYLEAAVRLRRRSCSGELRDADGRLLRTWKDGAGGSAPTSRITRSCSRRCSPCTRRPSSRAGTARR